MIEHRIRLALVSIAMMSDVGSAQTTVASQENPESAVAGEWRGEMFSGGVGTRLSLNLFDNGTYSQRSTMITEYGWTLDGSTLLMAPVTERGTEPTYGKALALEIRLEGDTLTAIASGERVVLRRITVPIDNSPLLGTWEGMSDMNETITQSFTSEGRLIVTVVIDRAAGRYNVSKNEIVWAEQIPRPRRHRSRYKLENDTLTLFSPSPLPPVKLERVTGGLQY
jgi:hypothetical protein